MPDILPALKQNILLVESEITRAQLQAKKDRGHPLRLEASVKELRALNVRLNALKQNLAAEDTR